MEFSQSFEFGNSTFMKLESQANHAIKDDQGNDSPNEKPLDVILESPVASKPDYKSSETDALNSKSRYMLNTTQYSSQQQRTMNGTQRRKFRRSKSDSILPKVTSLPKEDICDNYSEFCRSDFSILNNNTNELQLNEDKDVDISKGTSYLRVSVIETAFNDVEKVENIDAIKSSGVEDDFFHSDFSLENEDSEKGSLDKPIFSEDLKDLLHTEDVKDAEDNLWHDTLPLSIISNDVDDKNFEDPQMVLHDVSSFLYPLRENTEGRNHIINNDLEMSHKVYKEFEKHQLYASAINVSLSCMSPDQLQVTQDMPNSPKSEIVQGKRYPNKSNYQKPTHVINEEKSVAAAQKQGKLMVLPNNIEDLKYLSSWNLPHSILKEYERKGIKKMFDWQIQCLNNPKVLFEHCNLVYSAPTSAGKTLVSEILLLKTVLERGKKVLLILPFISVVREKMFYLQDLLTVAGYRVEGFYGGYSPPGGFDNINVAICTIEKANSIVNKLLEHGKLNEIGTVVVDEVHLISDPGRGYILELLLAKILYMSRKYDLQIQVIAMSATLANVELLKTWLDAELFITKFRPVALNEMIKVGNRIYDNNLLVLRSITELSTDIKEPFPSIPNDSDNVAQLCIETLIDGCSVVVFCPSKDWCENLSVQLAGAIHALGKQGGEWGTRLRAQLKREAIDDMKKQLRDIPTGLDTVLEKTVTYGCAFHHAGLTTEERDIIEASFKSGGLKIIVATSTLSSGVNLPARRVLIRSPLFGGKQMSSLTYRQMIGRAGRTGQDILGESILICTESNARVGKELITAGLLPISSCLEMDSSTHLKRALLEVISSGVATSKEDIDNFVNCTLLSAQKRISNENIENKDDEPEDEYIGSALDFLVEYEFVRLQINEESNEQHYVATRLGMACLASSMPPTDGLILFAELQKARRCFVLESELHAVYLVTPYSVCYQLKEIDWLFFLDMWEKLTPAMKKVGELVGVKESFLVRAMRGQTKLDYKLMQIHKRFYTALALQELVNETPINVVASKFKCSRGMLQSLQQMASTFAGIVTSFCSSLQWDTLSLIVSQFKERLYFGIHRDLIDLMRIPDLNHKRARTLFDAGITSLVELANSDVSNVEKILFNALSFDSTKPQENENATEAAQRTEARNFYITGKAGITMVEAAKLLVQEARQFVQHEIGVGNINWSLRSENVDNATTEKEENEIHMSYEESKFNNERKSTTKELDTALLLPSKCNVNDENLTNPKKVIDNKSDNQCAGNNKLLNGDIANHLPIKATNKNHSLKKTEVGTSCKLNSKYTKAYVNSNAEKIRPLETFEVDDGKYKEKHQTQTVEHKAPTQTVANTISNAKYVKNSVSLPDDFTNLNGKNGDEGEQILDTKSNVATNPDKERTSSIREESLEKIAIRKNKDFFEEQKDKPNINTNNDNVIGLKSPNKNICFDNDSQFLNAMKQVEENPKFDEIKKNPESFTAKRTSPKKRKSSEHLTKKNNETPPKVLKANNNLKVNKLDDEEKPSTSKKAQRLLRAKQLSDIKKQEWIKRRDDKELQKGNALNDKNNTKTNKVETMFLTNPEKTDPKPTPPPNIAKSNIKNLNEKSPNTPRSSHCVRNPKTNDENVSTKLPRRSPRNLISSTRIEHVISSPANTTPATKKTPSNTKQNIKIPYELFGDENEKPFIFNTDVNEALQNADNFKVTLAKNELNKSHDDEIPSSQQQVEDMPENKTNSPHASRFLRSLRATQRMQSPRVSIKSHKLNMLPPQETTSKLSEELIESLNHVAVETPTSTSIELSDFSMENSLMKNPIHLNASHILSCSKIDTDSSSFKSIEIIDICGDQQLFKGAFKEFMASKRLGFCVGIQQQSGKHKPIIGANLLLNQVAYAEKISEPTPRFEFQIDDNNYLAGIGFCISDNLVYYMNMQPEGSCKGLTCEIKSKYLRMLLRSSDHSLLMYDAKEQLKVLRKLFKDLGDISVSSEDPKIANWLLQPDKMHNLHSLAQQFAPECSALVNLCGNGRGYNSYGLDSESAIFAKVRCSIESCVTIHILKGQNENLERIGTGQLHKFFKELEMPLQVSLCNMEDIGFPTSSETLHKLFQQMVNTMKRLEAKIYELHGSKFNLGSSSAVARVLGLHRKNNGRVSTSKQILEKIDTPISQMIIIYRKLSYTLTKNIQPLLKCVVDERIHGSSITFTSTGRISMAEPNLQNVAKDFNIEIPSDKFTISCRSAFFSSDPKRCLISSDFCQLEMRILAHLSQDSALLQVIKSERDIFVAIAARWNKISETSVTEQMRNGTKQICYGIVYGMGMRALAEGLKCTEHEAKLVTQQFHAAYPGIRTYTEKIIKFARNNGYIETITGRRRYLEHINSDESLIKSQAERQAVNSTIQGSAADIAKSAILRMEKNIVKYRDKLGINPQSVRLVLHLHDELIFEVPEDKAKKIAKVLRVTMENCVKLNVPLKVKLKLGRSWGELHEINL